ncbi:MAG: carbohydrate kinase family protein [Chloroflexota bacterium]
MRATPPGGLGEGPADDAGSLMRVAVVGDCTLDVTARTDAPPIVGGDVPAQISLGPGGQGGNVAVRLARAGIGVRLAAAIADDAAGQLLASALEAEGVALARLPADRSGTVVALLDAAGERAMLSDRVTLDSRPIGSAVAGAEWVHCSGYPLADDATGDALAALLGALPAAVRVSMGGGSLPDDPDRARRVRARIEAAGVRLLVLSRDEAGALLARNLPSLPAAADALAGTFPDAIVVVTGGALGSSAAGRGFALSVPAQDPAVPVVDATGAGDAYAAGLIGRLLDVAWPPDVAALRAAMEAGSRLGGLVSRVRGAQGSVAGETGGGA